MKLLVARNDTPALSRKSNLSAEDRIGTFSGCRARKASVSEAFSTICFTTEVDPAASKIQADHGSGRYRNIHDPGRSSAFPPTSFVSSAAARLTLGAISATASSGNRTVGPETEMPAIASP